MTKTDVGENFLQMNAREKMGNTRIEHIGPHAVRVRLEGVWNLGGQSPDSRDIVNYFKDAKEIKKIEFESRGLERWDTVLPAYLSELMRFAREAGIEIDEKGLPEGVRKLVRLASEVPERQGARKNTSRESFLYRTGDAAVDFWKGILEMFDFIGACCVATMKIFTGKARFQGSDLLLFIQECGVSSLPIVSLISLLFGLILAFVGSVQLAMFGAQLYVANLVAIAVVRVMGAVMCGVIMAGRIGAAFAAQLGTMQVSEEVDALKTLAISPIEFLVLPRIMALVLMMPLLCLFADAMGILGGLIVGVYVLDINLLQYVKQTEESLNLTQFAIGLVHSVVFGVLIAVSGCYKGIKCGRSASAVGAATTSAVVVSIVSIVVATAIITIICDILNL